MEVRFTGVCVCGARLEPAFHPEHKLAFWNCFRCFPVFPKAGKKWAKPLIAETERLWGFRYRKPGEERGG